MKAATVKFTFFFFLYIIHACSCHDWYFNSSLKAQWWFQGAAQDKQSTRGLLKNSMVLKIVLPLVFRVSVTGSSDGCTVDYAPWLVDSQSPKIGRQHPNPARTHAHQGTSGWLKHWHEQTDLVRADGKEGRILKNLTGDTVRDELFSGNLPFFSWKGKCLAQVQVLSAEAWRNKPKAHFKSCRSHAQSLYHPDSLYKQNQGMLSPLSLAGVKPGSPEA